MTQQTMLEISNPFDVYVKKLGYGVAMFLFIGSNTCNPNFMVKIYNDGKMRMVDMIDMLVYGNPQYGEDLIPQIPEDWLVK